MKTLVIRSSEWLRANREMFAPIRRDSSDAGKQALESRLTRLATPAGAGEEEPRPMHCCLGLQLVACGVTDGEMGKHAEPDEWARDHHDAARRAVAKGYPWFTADWEEAVREGDGPEFQGFDLPDALGAMAGVDVEERQAAGKGWLILGGSSVDAGTAMGINDDFTTTDEEKIALLGVIFEAAGWLIDWRPGE